MKKIIKNDDFNTNSNNNPTKYTQPSLPPFVISRAKSIGTIGEVWLDNLDSMIFEMEKMWNISVGKVLSGSTHAFVDYADGQNGEKYVLKLDMPENLGNKFYNIEYSVFEQLQIVCFVLQKVWEISITNVDLLSEKEGISQFREHIKKTWKKLKRPCLREVSERAFFI